MLAVVSPLTSTRDESQKEMELESFNSIVGTPNDVVQFGDLSEGNLLESINFDDLFVGIDVDGDELPDLEMDGDVFPEFSAAAADTAVGCGGGEDSEMTSSVENCGSKGENSDKIHGDKKKEDNEGKISNSDSGDDSGSNFGTSRREEIVSKRDESVVGNPSAKEGGKGRKCSSQSKSNHHPGKRKVKVDWTPELHRRFVQAVEQLGVDKAVPSRILEIMGIKCLTRHNIASHLQKYRSNRKHLLAREAEAANWSQRRQMCGGKREVMSPWLAPPPPTLGFPPMHHFRPLHVWGHPSMDQSFMQMWPKHLRHSLSPPPPPAWLPPPPLVPQPLPDPSFWHAQHQRMQAPKALTPGTPCFPQQPLTTTRFGSPPPVPGIGVPGPRPLVDFHPSKESIDEAVEDVLSKPWLPLPLGLKAPALDSVLNELQRQGIQKIPPSCA